MPWTKVSRRCAVRSAQRLAFSGRFPSSPGWPSNCASTAVTAARSPPTRSSSNTAANPAASEVGIEVLRRGGSAIDAAVAVQFMLNLVEPESSGIGGGAFAGTGAVAKFSGTTEAYVKRTDVIAGGLSVAADSKNRMHLVGGALAGVPRSVCRVLFKPGPSLRSHPRTCAARCGRGRGSCRPLHTATRLPWYRRVRPAGRSFPRDFRPQSCGR